MNINRKKILVAFMSLIVFGCGENADQSTELNNVNEIDQIQVIDTTKPHLKLSEETLNVKKGEEFTLKIELNVFPKTEGGGVNVAYSADVLHVKKVSINNKDWNFVNRQGDIDNTKGVIENILVSSYQGVENKSVLATITFEAVSIGGSSIVLSESAINPFSTAGTKVNPQFIHSHISVR